MFKTLATLMRGAAAQAEEDLIDAHALLVLDQQIREVAATLDAAKRALAVATVQRETEVERAARVAAAIADLESRAVAALAAGSDALAEEAAVAIAQLEADRAALADTVTAFTRETDALSARVTKTAAGLATLERGRRIARAAEAVRRLSGARTAAAQRAAGASLADAEATLRRLRSRQVEDAAAETALARIEDDLSSTSVSGVTDRLAAAGFGARNAPAANDILDRLRLRAAAA